MERAFSQNLYEHDVKFPFATLFGGRKHRNQFNFFSESEIGRGPQDPVLKFTILREMKEKRENLFKKIKQTNNNNNNKKN